MPTPERLHPSLASSVRQLALDPMEEARKRLIVALDVPERNGCNRAGEPT